MINQFGIAFDSSLSAVYAFAKTLDNLSIHGIDCHIGSQLPDIEPFIDATDRLLALIGPTTRQ